MKPIVLDTNILVAAGFNAGSRSARIVDAVRQGHIDLIWNDATHAESRSVIQHIPPLSWEDFADLYQPEHAYSGDTNPAAFDVVPDADDRKFAALAQAARAILVSNDDHLLDVRDQLDVEVLTSSEYVDRYGAQLDG